MKTRSVLAVVLALAASVSAAAPDARFIPDRLKQLCAPDAAEREGALSDLMALSADDLPALRRAAESLAPLRPAQAEAVHDVIVHVLTRRAVMQLPTSGRAFMGVRMTDNADAVAGGVIVCDTLPGFVAGRFLQGGDVIAGLRFDGQAVPFNTRAEFSDLIGKLQPGTVVDLDIRRGQRTLVVRVRLDAKPGTAAAGLEDVQNEQISRVTEEAAAAAEQAFTQDYAMLAAAE